jgi:hypothetical protein
MLEIQRCCETSSPYLILFRRENAKEHALQFAIVTSLQIGEVKVSPSSILKK